MLACSFRHEKAHEKGHGMKQGRLIDAVLSKPTRLQHTADLIRAWLIQAVNREKVYRLGWCFLPSSDNPACQGNP